MGPAQDKHCWENLSDKQANQNKENKKHMLALPIMLQDIEDTVAAVELILEF